jgi:predicted AlkP superfamily pyrophosphatase or phosphodiesterase
MDLPSYKNGSIVNLMSSIAIALGDTPLYEPLEQLKPEVLSQSKNIVLLVVDGLGYEYVVNHGKGSIFYENLKDKITSVFPSTTAASLTTFATGLAPQQHGITGWFTYLKELGMVSAVLPFKPRNGGLCFSQTKVKPQKIFDQQPLFEKFKVPSYVVTYKDFVKSDYTRATTGKTKRIQYRGLTECFREVKKVIFSHNRRKFIYAYWSEFDHLCHKHGTTSKEVTEHFQYLNAKLASFLKSIDGTNTMVLITADHGVIDTDQSRTIALKNHPTLYETLTLPLCGEPRLAYCYVRPFRTKLFEDYIRERFSEVCELHKSEDLVEKNYFGLFDPHKNLLDRIGDYVLIMKDRYVIKDFVLGEKEYFPIGNHGGLSKEEVFVPLVIIQK